MSRSAELTPYALVEDDPVVADLVRQTLDENSGFRCLATCATGVEAVTRLPALRPEVILFDLILGGHEGFGDLRRLKERLPTSLVLAVTSHDDSRMIFAALSAGADGYLLKSDTTLPLTGAIREALAGGRPLSRSVAQRVMRYFHDLGRDALDAGIDRLTPRELQVLEGIHVGYTNREIGRNLGISEETVRKEVRSILEKLRVSNRAEAAGVFARHDARSRNR